MRGTAIITADTQPPPFFSMFQDSLVSSLLLKIPLSHNWLGKNLLTEAL